MLPPRSQAAEELQPMFVIVLTYVKPLSEVDKLIDAHMAYLDRNYKAGMFVVSGRRVPRVGGVILARAESIAQVEEAVVQDPFIREGVAEYQIIEFLPTTWAPGFEDFR
jgi:uncharacterized protein YciI